LLQYNIMKQMLQYPIAGADASEIGSSIEDGVRLGKIPHGAMLPPVRALAAALKVSPTTVAAAYRTLRQRGLLNAHGRRGTHISARPPVLSRLTLEIPRGLRNLMQGSPDPQLLPDLRAVASRLTLRPRLYGETTNRPQLLALAARQLTADCIPTTALAIMGGALDAIERVLQAHVRPGDRVAVEDPGYSEIFDLLGALGLVAEPVGIDEFGLIPDALERVLRNRVTACIFTPRAQNPLGAALDEQRARDLRKVFAKHADVLVIEDDHAGPVAGAPALTVCHQKKERWAVVRSVSKSLGPDLRLAVVAGDATTIARVEGRQSIGAGWVSHILQEIVETLWSDAATTEKLRLAAETYAARRTALMTALKAHGIAAYGRSGLNVWIPAPEEGNLITSLAAAGWAVRGGERYRLKSPPAIRVTIATLPPDDAVRLAADVARCLRSDHRTHSV
jgi:DNA-binding transcriptional MocR family regulator